MNPQPVEPFSKHEELLHGFDPTTGNARLPGWPCIKATDTDAIRSKLDAELWAAELEKRASYLWILTTPSSANIWSLHEQIVWGRGIVITEDPRLHLVWSKDRVFIKPVPSFLLSWDVWKTYLRPSQDSHLTELRRAALGFLRTYVFLIQHESDLAIAQSSTHQLLPATVKWDELSQLLCRLNEIKDEHVSGRYQYGEIRLSRLDNYAPLLFRRRWYMVHHMPIQYAEYFAQIYGPVLVAFAVLSLILSTMQVVLSTDVAAPWYPRIVRNVFYWFSIVVMLIVVAIAASFGVLAVVMLLNEWCWSFLTLQKRDRSSHGKVAALPLTVPSSHKASPV